MNKTSNPFENLSLDKFTLKNQAFTCSVSDSESLNESENTKESSPSYQKPINSSKIENSPTFTNNSAFKLNLKFKNDEKFSIFCNPSMYQKAILLSKHENLNFHNFCFKCKNGVLSGETFSSGMPLEISKPIRFCFLSGKTNRGKKLDEENSKKKRKMDRDCIHKKIKARLFKYIKDTVRGYIVESITGLKIPQKIISDVTFEFNRNLINSRVGSIFVESNLYFGSKKQISEIAKNGKKEELISFLFKPIKDCIFDYVASEYFESDLKKFNNEHYVESFKNYVNEFTTYYNDENSRKNKKKQDV